MARIPIVSNPSVLSNPLVQPLVQFPIWVSGAVDRSPGREETLADVVEATVAGYLFVRIQDDRLDDDVGDPDTAMFLADMFLIRHQVLLARHVGRNPKFWELFQSVAEGYVGAMLFEQEAVRRESQYDAEVFDLVLARSRPLLLPGAALLSVSDRWELLQPLRRFVSHVVRAGQLIDDLVDCVRDLERGRFTWVVRRLGGEHGSELMVQTLINGGIDDIVADVMADLDSAGGAAVAVGMTDAAQWIEARRAAAIELRDKMLLSALFG
jgi:hypothetical protein